MWSLDLEEGEVLVFSPFLYTCVYSVYCICMYVCIYIYTHTSMYIWVLAEMPVSENDRFICSDGGPLLVLFICHLWVILDGTQ